MSLSYTKTYTNTSCTLHISGMVSGTAYRVYCRTNYYGGTSLGDIEIVNDENVSYLDSTYVITGLDPGTPYTVNVGTQSEWVGGQSFTTPSGRPSDWSWTSSVIQGGAVETVLQPNGVYYAYYLTAEEWNSFTTRINEFRSYKGYSNYSFTQAVAGTEMTAAVVNQARTAISTMSPPTALPAAISSGGSITAAFINGLKNSLNSIV